VVAVVSLVVNISVVVAMVEVAVVVMEEDQIETLASRASVITLPSREQ
jgi:hypothetical protein